MHYDVFRLADDTPKEVLDRLEAEWERRLGSHEGLKRMEPGGILRM